MPFFSRKPGQSSTSDSGYSNDPRLDLSVSQVQRRPHSKSPSPQRMPSLPTVMEERSEDASSVSRHSLSTQSTTTDDRDSVDLADAVRSYQLSRTQAIPSLPTIDSGEPLTWDTMRPPTDDPFTTPTRPRTFLPSHDYERPQSTSSFHSAWSVPSRPNSAHTSSLPQDPYTPSHQPQVGIRLLSGKSPVDHFKYDAEGYATGAFPRSLYRSPRSRSPTPAVDDEDYRISADGSVHYSGQSRTAGHAYDNTRSVQQPQYTEVAEGDDDDDEEYEEDDDEDTGAGGDDDTKGEGEAEEEDEYETEDDISEKPKYMPKPKKWINFSGLSPDATSADRADLVPQTTQHFGPAPTGRIHRRHKKRRVQLTNGKLIIDLPVPPKLILPLRKSDQETGFTRYTAVTCDPDEFEKSGFFLRQNEQNRSTELFICVTMYNVRSSVCCSSSPRFTNLSSTCRRMRSYSAGRYTG